MPKRRKTTNRQFLYRDADDVLRWHDVPQRSMPKATYPFCSDAIGVHPAQVADARAESVQLGVPTDFTPDGRAVLRTPGHRKAYCEAIGVFDRNGGFSDPRRK